MRKVIILMTMLFVYIGGIWSQTYTLENKWVDCGNNVQLNDPYYSPGVTFQWSGASSDGKANGFGIAIKYKDGNFESKYEGTYKNGIREGKGKFTHMDGSVKTGTFIDGQLMGHGTLSTEDGHTYEGEFINYRMHGEGILRFANGAVFEGIMADDAPYTGKFTNYDGSITYIQCGEPVEYLRDSKSNYSPKIGQRITEYFDKDWKRCQPKEASFYRLVTYKAPHRPDGIVRDYYITGELQSEQYPVYIDYDDDACSFLEGEQTFYYKTGEVESKRLYYNNRLNGPLTTYYKSGALASKVMFSFGVPHGDATEYYENGKLATVRKYEHGRLHNNKYLNITEDDMVFLVYNENFISNREAWEYRGQSGIVQVNDEETISMQASPERTVSGGIYTGFAPTSENIISVTTHQRNPGKGVVTFLFGYKDWDNTCAFSIAGDKFQFTYIKNGVTVQCDEWQTSSHINPDVNQLMIVNAGDNIKFLINEELVKEIGRIYYDGSLCGVSLYNPSYEPIVIDAAQLAVYEVVDPRSLSVEYLLEEDSDPTPNAWKGNGTGFFVNPQGYIATNYHVVEGVSAIQVNFTRNGKSESYPAKVVATDPQNDLAILQIDDAAFHAVQELPYGLLSRTIDTGSEVFALGYPIADVMGTEVKFTDGKISSKSGIQGDVRVYQISVPIQPGNSGGPLFNMEGDVVGITSSGLNRDYFKSENVNYAIKAAYLKSLIEACPQQIYIDEGVKNPMAQLSLTELIKQYTDFIVLILTK